MTAKKVLGFETWYKRPVAIQAKQMKQPFEVKTLEGTMKGKTGDYLIIGIKGEQYPCDKEIFENSYSKRDLIDGLEHKYQMTKQALECREAELRNLKNGVPVRLASESVSLKWLEQYCEKNKFGFRPPRVNAEELLKAARKQAGENK